MAGFVFLCVVLLASTGAVLCYGTEREKTGCLGRVLVYLAFFAAFAAAAVLMGFLLTNRFDIAYVAAYSSKNLPLMYKISAFWAGQEGSFLLWLLIHATAGAWLVYKGRMKYGGLTVYLLIQLLLTVLCVEKSPFRPIEESVLDGVGLNPLLQDPWMAIHPPIIFVGYALLAVPFAYCCGALIEKDMGTGWMNSVRRWGLCAWAFLGAGIFIGGYWAYKVLGWGGYWGWDPVENSSLVPWLVTGVMLHVLCTAKIRPAVIPMVHLSVIFTYTLVIYGTFLTRSGILGDFSVHSFSGTEIGLMLAVADGTVLLAGLILMIVRAGLLTQGEMYTDHNSREFFMLLGSLLIVFASAIVFIGMSMPLLTQLVSKPAAVNTDFYVRTLMPLAVVLMLVMGIGSLKRWGKQTEKKRLILPMAFFVLGIMAALGIGLRAPLPILLSGASLFAVGCVCMAKKKQLIKWGGFTAHLGVAIGLFAIVLSGSGSRQVSGEFITGTPQQLFGHEIIYEGQRFTEDGSEKRYVFRVDGTEYSALTKLRANGEDAAREPAIGHFAAGDVYIAPSPLSAERREMLLKHGKIAMDEAYAYRFESVEYEEKNDGTTLVTADVEITDGERVEHAKPWIRATAEGGTSKPVEVFGGASRIRLTGVSSDGRTIRMECMPSLESEQAMPVTASVSIKPGIWILWLGTVLVTIGCIKAAKE